MSRWRRHPLTPYRVERTPPHTGARVWDRATGRLLGTVAQHYSEAGRHHRCWSAWPPYEDGSGDEALGGYPLRTRNEVIRKHLMNPVHHETEWSRKRCADCSRQIWPRRPPCDQCEPDADAKARHRKQFPDWHEHYEWLLATYPQGASHGA